MRLLLSFFMFAAALAVSARAGDRDVFTTKLTQCPSNEGIIEYSCYVVEGKIPREIKGSIRANSPHDTQSWGRATSQLKYRYSYDVNSSGSCHVISARVSYSCKISVPIWAQPSDATPYTISAWESMFKALIEHEKTHCRITQEWAAELESRLGAVTAPACLNIDEAVKLVWKDGYAEYRGKQKEFDAHEKVFNSKVDIPLPRSGQ